MGCTCQMPCPCRYNNTRDDSCEEWGLIVITQGSFGKIQLNDIKLVWASGTSFEAIYLDMRINTLQRQVMSKLIKAGVFGVEDEQGPSYTKIEYVHNKNNWQIDATNVLKCAIKAVLGADGKQPIRLRNMPWGTVGELYMDQGQVVKSHFQTRSFEIIAEGTNAYFGEFRHIGTL